MSKIIVKLHPIKKPKPKNVLTTSEDFIKFASISGICHNKRISHFYEEIYARMMGGKNHSGSKFDPEKVLNNTSRFSPDIVFKNEEYTLLTEVKATSTKSDRFPCSQNQFLNYLNYLNNKDTSDLYYLNYAFFKYLKNGENRSKQKALITGLTKQTKDLLILPLNLTLLLLMDSNFVKQNHTTSHGGGYVNYWMVLGGDVGHLTNHAPEKAVNYLIDKLNPQKKEIAEKYLLLERVFKKESQAEELRISLRGMTLKLNPFTVTEYTIGKNNKLRKKWYSEFKKNYGIILEEGLKISKESLEAKVEEPF